MKTIVLACGIFQEEIEYFLRENPVPGLEIIWLEVGLHDNIEKMEETLDERIAEVRAANNGAEIALLYGMACLPTMKDFAAAHGVKVLPERNCLAALVGDAKSRDLEQNRTLLASTGWVRKMWLGRAGTASGWQADDFRMHCGRYDRVLVLDTGLSPLSDEEIITCFDLVQVPLEIMECSLDYFSNTVKTLLGSC
jgi:hypothetical protein